MTITTEQFLFNPTDLVLELDGSILDQAWASSQNMANPNRSWQSYLNQVVSNTFLAWVKAEEAPEAKAGFDSATHADIWEAVNGSKINLKNSKLVLIPSEAADRSELRVPALWVDIPEWMADYYLAVQVNVDDGYLCLWGFATYQQLKNNGRVNNCSRTYSLDDDKLICDVNVLWLTRELCC